MKRAHYLSCSGEDWEKARMRALVRDGFQCQHAGCTETRLRHLQVHHVMPRIRGGTHDLENLLTLCDAHHAERHPHLQRLLSQPERALDGYPWKEL